MVQEILLSPGNREENDASVFYFEGVDRKPCLVSCSNLTLILLGGYMKDVMDKRWRPCRV